MYRQYRGAVHACAVVGLLTAGIFSPARCWAYRPFISTDAAVADPKEG